MGRISYCSFRLNSHPEVYPLYLYYMVTQKWAHTYVAMICYLICWRHSIAVKNRIFSPKRPIFLHACTTWSDYHLIVVPGGLSNIKVVYDNLRPFSTKNFLVALLRLKSVMVWSLIAAQGTVFRLKFVLVIAFFGSEIIPAATNRKPCILYSAGLKGVMDWAKVGAEGTVFRMVI